MCIYDNKKITLLLFIINFINASFDFTDEDAYVDIYKF